MLLLFCEDWWFLSLPWRWGRAGQWRTSRPRQGTGRPRPRAGRVGCRRSAWPGSRGSETHLKTKRDSNGSAFEVKSQIVWEGMLSDFFKLGSDLTMSVFVSFAHASMSWWLVRSLMEAMLQLLRLELILLELQFMLLDWNCAFRNSRSFVINIQVKTWLCLRAHDSTLLDKLACWTVIGGAVSMLDPMGLDPFIQSVLPLEPYRYYNVILACSCSICRNYLGEPNLGACSRRSSWKLS